MSTISIRRAARAAIALAAAVAVVGAVPSAAQAKADAVGDFSVTLNGTTYDPSPGNDAKVSGVTPTGPIRVTGRHVTFTIDPSTLGVYDYSLTGAASPDRMVSRPTVIFASKVPVLTAAQRSGTTVKQLEVRDGTVVITFATAAGKLKVQAKDAPTGGIFQMEPEFASRVELVHTLGPTLFYFVNPFTGKINFGDGADPVTPAQSPTGHHQMLLGKDSPQVATKLFQDGTVTRWSVEPGGRLGGVLGEDAIELSAGATSCTSRCQAQNQVRGSLTVPPLPTNPTPIG
ncbi:hypothetical protein [Aeromicrobium sp. Root472D3]|uniref:hypothetical protein n=1 Tax=Aeromicrobium sp. Root472D3 TaxID=1736540 RepID=UPI0006F96133|nr:hypothetical protein [Aeromicrobium sp. Root472D3]KQX75129.1 hypothetical protein ASD10_08005 [Aeromicrobium sp. Root472D3]